MIFAISIFLFAVWLIGFPIGISIQYTDEDKKSFARWWKFAVVLPIAFLIASFFTIISTGEVGIRTSFGRVVSTIQNPGIQFKLPWEEVHIMNVKVQKYENEEALEGSTKDLQIINNVMVAINYQLNAEKTLDLFSRVGDNYKEVILYPAIQESVKSEISKYNAEDLAVLRSEVSGSMTDSLNSKLNEYGISISAVSFKNFDFSAEYSEAIEKKAVATQEALAAQERLQKAKVEAEQKIVQAKAEAEANQLLQSTLTDNVIKQQFIEKWNGQLPTVSGSSSILDVSSLIK